jgi:TM2 domain-containing membrane protein YozV
MRTPLILSLAVFPGAGQFCQGRKLAGILLALLFIAAIAAAMSSLAASIITMYKTGIENFTWLGSFLHGIAWFAAAIAVHGINVLDVVLAERRSKTTQHPPP